MESINKIAVLYGGSSGEREVSIESGKRVFDAIIELGYESKKFDINDIDDLHALLILTLFSLLFMEKREKVAHYRKGLNQLEFHIQALMQNLVLIAGTNQLAKI